MGFQSVLGGLVWITCYFVWAEAQMAVGKQKMCSVKQNLTDLDCPCRFRGLPCRVPGSVCTTGFIPGGLENELRCQCQGTFLRNTQRSCVEKPSGLFPKSAIADVVGTTGQMEEPNNIDFTVNSRVGFKQPSPKHPGKKPPFKTVFITSNPLSALAPSRRPQVNPFHRPNFQNGFGIGVEGPSPDSILTQSRPRDWTRPPFSSKGQMGGKGTGFQKGTHVSKRPPTRFQKRTTRAIPRADGSRVVNGWYPDIWPAVGLNYSI